MHDNYVTSGAFISCIERSYRFWESASLMIWSELFFLTLASQYLHDSLPLICPTYLLLFEYFREYSNLFLFTFDKVVNPITSLCEVRSALVKLT